MKTLLLFDIDGTLLLTGGAGRIAFERAFFKLHGIPKAWGPTVPDGKTDPVIIDEIARRELGRSLDSEENQVLENLYVKYFAEEIRQSQNYRLLPGVPELLQSLSEIPDTYLSLGTGNFEMTSWLKLERGGIRHFFKCGGFGSDSPLRQEVIRAGIQKSEHCFGEKFQTDRIFVVGDTAHDVKAAQELKVHSIGVNTGKSGGNQFKEYSPTHLLEDLTDIRAFLECLGLHS